MKNKCNLSSSITLNTGAPQGCVLSPKLYSIFTFDCKITTDSASLIIKFADDTTVTGFINNSDETKYINQVNNIVDWCDNNNLLLNVDKTKEMIVDFRKKAETPPPPLKIGGSVVEQVTSFKFLGTFVNNTLTWNTQCHAILMKAKQRFYFLRKLKHFGVISTILTTFYRAIVESVLTQAITEIDISSKNRRAHNWNIAYSFKCSLSAADG